MSQIEENAGQFALDKLIANRYISPLPSQLPTSEASKRKATFGLLPISLGGRHVESHDPDRSERFVLL